jgi:hypothetical protein
MKESEAMNGPDLANKGESLTGCELSIRPDGENRDDETIRDDAEKTSDFSNRFEGINLGVGEGRGLDDRVGEGVNEGEG